MFFIPLLLLTLATEGARFLLSDNNLLSKVLLSVYTPSEYLLLSLFLVKIINAAVKKKIILLSIPFFILLSFAVQFTTDGTNYFYKYLDALVEAPLILIWTLFYFFQLFSDDETFHFGTNPFFWISAGNLLFFAGSFFSYGFAAYFNNTGEYNFAEAVRWIARTLNILLYIFYIAGFLCSGQKK